MKDLLDPVNLLDTARAALREQVLEYLPDECRTVGLMIANALAIAGREIAGQHALDEWELEMLVRMMTKKTQMDYDSVPQDADTALRRELCLLIRRGEADEGSPLHNSVIAYVRERQLRCVRISNPRYLEGGRENSRSDGH